MHATTSHDDSRARDPRLVSHRPDHPMADRHVADRWAGSCARPVWSNTACWDPRPRSPIKVESTLQQTATTNRARRKRLPFKKKNYLALNPYSLSLTTDMWVILSPNYFLVSCASNITYDTVYTSSSFAPSSPSRFSALLRTHLHPSLVAASIDRSEQNSLPPLRPCSLTLLHTS